MAATCPVCGARIAKGEQFCPNCGLAFAEAPVQPPRPMAEPARSAIVAPTIAMRRCPHCGSAVKEQARACVVCGRALAYTTGALLRPLRPGRLLASRYTITRMLSKGGMGAIYLATDRQTGHHVVVKALVDYFDTNDARQTANARARLAHEAATLGQLAHPCVPRMLGVCEDGAQLYLVMEYIGGVDLDQRLSRTASDSSRTAGQPFPLPDVLRWGVALCRVLEYLAAQPHPVIHHDIKPANVLVDPAADTVYLVDFGTARVQLDPNGSVGLKQSSLYGTVGYAPPEQYRGRSEPRSDVYALAATLYHLASDDDPSDHPFSFPKLGTLGAFGYALRDALDSNVQRRPEARELRRRLKGLLDLSGVGLLRAPDGGWLADEDALASWCLREWDQAAEWLRNGLPDQIGRWWDDQLLAEGLRLVVEAEPDRDMALDQALALLDPAGLGREQPQLVCDTPELDFGSLPSNMVRRDITIENRGRRHVALYVFLPRWVKGNSGLLALPPGRRTVLSLAPDLSRVYLGGRLRGEVLVRDHYGRTTKDRPLLRIPLQARVPRRYILSRYGLPLGGAGLALLVWLGAGLPMPHTASALLPALLAEQDTKAQAPLIGQTNALQAARRHLREGNYQGARAELQTLLANAPGYGDAEGLLVETYRRAARSALDRGDLGGARLELEALLVRPEGQPSDADLHRQVLELHARAAAERADWQAATADILTLWELDPANETATRLVAANGELSRTVMDYRQATWASGHARIMLHLPVTTHDIPVLSPDGSMIALIGVDGRLHIHRTANGAIVSNPVEQVADNYRSVVFSPDGERIAARQGMLVYLWRVRDGAAIGGSSIGSPISSLAFTPDSRTLVVQTAVGTRVIATYADGRMSESYGPVPDVVRSTGPEQAVLQGDGSIAIAVSGSVVATVRVPGTNATAAVLSADSGTLAVLGGDGTLTIFRHAP